MEEKRMIRGSGMGSVASELREALSRAGYQYAVAPIDAASSLWEEVSRLCEEGLLSEEMFVAYQESWRFIVPEAVAEPQTLVAVAWPAMPAKVRFHMDDGPMDTIVPPTYIYSEGRARCLEVMRSVLEPGGYGVDWARVPVKLLAVRSGLAQYGRNNLTYVPGWGSFARLGALCTDAVLLAADQDAESIADTVSPFARDLTFMDECLECRACSRACPTGCIPENGTVINAARCLSEANENEGVWPEWMSERAHNSLVGCMRCQEVCPADRAYLDAELETIAEFDRDETQVILKDLPLEQLPERLRERLVTLDLDEYSTVLGRNLLALQRAR